MHRDVCTESRNTTILTWLKWSGPGCPGRTFVKESHFAQQNNPPPFACVCRRKGAFQLCCVAHSKVSYFCSFRKKKHSLQLLYNTHTLPTPAKPAGKTPQPTTTTLRGGAFARSAFHVVPLMISGYDHIAAIHHVASPFLNESHWSGHGGGAQRCELSARVLEVVAYYDGSLITYAECKS